MAYPVPIFGWATAAPTATTEYHQAGEIRIDPTPVAGKVSSWVCVTAGYPGTWKPIGFVNPGGVNEITAAAQIGAGHGVVLISMAAGTCTFAAVAGYDAGFEMLVKNLANVNLTLATAAGATYSDAAAVTLTHHQTVVLVGDGTTWHKKAA